MVMYKTLAATPRRTFLAHGVPIAAAALVRALSDERDHHAEAAAMDASIDLD